MTTYTHILDLAKEAEPPADGILSRTVFQDVRRRQRDAPQPGEDRHEQQVRHEVDGERQRHPPGHRRAGRLHEHEPEAGDDDRVEDRPDQADRRRGRRPARLRQRLVPLRPRHARFALRAGRGPAGSHVPSYRS